MAFFSQSRRWLLKRPKVFIDAIKSSFTYRVPYGRLGFTGFFLAPRRVFFINHQIGATRVYRRLEE